MKAEYDFSKGTRGKFCHSNAVFSFPIYLEPDVDDFMSKLAEEQDIDIQKLVNEWLRVNIKLLQSVQQSQSWRRTTRYENSATNFNILLISSPNYLAPVQISSGAGISPISKSQQWPLATRLLETMLVESSGVA